MEEKFIAHQTNCVSKGSAGTALDIFNKFPYSNDYVKRESPSTPGTIIIHGNGMEDRYIINMFAQYYPGKTKYVDSQLDGIEARQKYFHKCLHKISQIPQLTSIAFPVGIGCNLAGGNWDWYHSMLNKFEKYVNEKFSTKVVLYQHNSKK